MGLARVALVAVERPRRVVLGIGAHQPVAADLGEDAGRGDDEAAGIGLDHPLDVADVRRHEVPAAVDDRGVGHARDSWAIARLAARRCAAAIPSSSHSTWVAWPTPHVAHHEATRSKSRSRSPSVSIFESRMPLSRRSRGSTAAPTESGPAHAPRPTSSMPTTTG